MWRVVFSLIARRELARLVCVTAHWRRQRDSYGNKCVRCGMYW